METGSSLSDFSLVLHLQQLENHKSSEPDLISYCWNYLTALFVSKIDSPAAQASLTSHQVRQLDIDYINNLERDHFLELPFRHFTKEQIAGLEYTQVAWMIEAEKVAAVVDYLNIHKLYFVLAEDRSHGAEVFKGLSSLKLEALLELEEQDPAIKVRELMLKLFVSISAKEKKPLWKKHYSEFPFRRVHRLMLHVFHSPENKDIYDLLDNDIVCELFKKTRSPEENQGLVDSLSVNQILLLLAKATLPKTAARLKRNVGSLITKLSWDVVIKLLEIAAPEQSFYLFNKIISTEAGSEFFQQIPSCTINKLFYTAFESKELTASLTAISIFRFCENQELLKKLILEVSAKTARPNTVAREFGKAIPSFPETNRRLIREHAAPPFLVELVNGLATSTSKIGEYLDVISLQGELLKETDLYTQCRLYAYYLEAGICTEGLLHQLGEPIPFLLTSQTFSADQLREMIGGQGNEKIKIPLMEALLHNKHPNLMRAGALLFPERLNTKEDLPLIACMLLPSELKKRLQSINPDETEIEWIKKLAENIFQKDNRFRSKQIKILFRWMKQFNLEIFAHCLTHLGSKELMIEFSVLAFLAFEPEHYDSLLKALTDRMRQQFFSSLEIFPEILKALLIKEKTKRVSEYVIQAFLDNQYAYFEFLPSFDQPSEELNKDSYAVLENLMSEMIKTFPKEETSENFVFKKEFDKIDKFLGNIIFIQSESCFCENETDRKIKISTNYTSILEVLIPLFFIDKMRKDLGIAFSCKISQLKESPLYQTCLDAYFEMERIKYQQESEADVWSFVVQRGASLTSNQLCYEGQVFVSNLQKMGDYISTIHDLRRFNLLHVNPRTLFENLKKFEEEINKSTDKEKTKD